jgi:hypothetical protein
MMANGTAAYGMYPRNVALPEVVYALNRAGFGNEDICMVLSPAHPVATVVRDAQLLDAKPEESATSARMIGWFSEFGAVVIPTVGFFIRSQAFFHALLIEQNFPAMSRGSRTLVGLGFSEDEAKRLATSYATWARWSTSHVRKIPRPALLSNCCVVQGHEKPQASECRRQPKRRPSVLFHAARAHSSSVSVISSLLLNLPRVADSGSCALPITHLGRPTYRARRLARQLHFLSQPTLPDPGASICCLVGQGG